MRLPPVTALMVLFVLFLPAHACSQSLEAATPSEVIDSGTTPDASRYRELSFYSAQSFGYPKIMSDLKDQRLAVFGGRFTGRLYRFPHLNLNSNTTCGVAGWARGGPTRRRMGVHWGLGRTMLGRTAAVIYVPPMTG